MAGNSVGGVQTERTSQANNQAQNDRDLAEFEKALAEAIPQIVQQALIQNEEIFGPKFSLEDEE